jgi:hypothetical protein
MRISSGDKGSLFITLREGPAVMDVESETVAVVAAAGGGEATTDAAA